MPNWEEAALSLLRLGWKILSWNSLVQAKPNMPTDSNIPNIRFTLRCALQQGMDFGYLWSQHSQLEYQTFPSSIRLTRAMGSENLLRNADAWRLYLIMRLPFLGNSPLVEMSRPMIPCRFNDLTKHHTAERTGMLRRQLSSSKYTTFVSV